jgi:hypothetical protein
VNNQFSAELQFNGDPTNFRGLNPRAEIVRLGPGAGARLQNVGPLIHLECFLPEPHHVRASILRTTRGISYGSHGSRHERKGLMSHSR